jgi:hypothetical protein
VTQRIEGPDQVGRAAGTPQLASRTDTDSALSVLIF